MLSSSRVLWAALLTAAASQPAFANSNNSQDLVKELFATYKGEAVKSIADAARRSKRLAGTAVALEPLNNDAGYSEVLNAEYDYMTPENAGKWGVLQQVPGQWDFGPHDELVSYGAANRKAYKGHTLVWHSQAPEFITSDLSATEVQQLLDDHVTTTLNRYAGQFYAWDVVNEAIEEDGSYRDSVYFQKLGAGYIANAFERARQLDPGAKRFYNDYNIAGFNAKSDGVYAMLKGLKAAGVPVDGIGFQMHLSADTAPGYDEMVANFQRFAELGLDINISELDVRVSNLPWDKPTRMAIQKQVYQRVVSACMKVQKCGAVTTWGFSDMYSWVDATYGADDPLPFDESFQRKPAYFGLVDGFMGLPPDAMGANPNLVANGNVEAGLHGWTSRGGKLSRSHLSGQTGIAAVVVSGRTETWNGPSYDLLDSVRGGLTYDAQAFVAIAGSKRDTAKLSVQYRCEGGADTFVQLATRAVRDSQFDPMAGSFTLPDCALEAASIYVEGPAKGVTLRVDNVSVRPRTLVPDDTGLGENIVTNANFEEDAFGWFGFGTATVDISSVFASTGSQSGFVSNRGDTWQGPATSLLLDAEAGTDYQVLAWVRMETGSAQINGTIKASCPTGDQYLYIGSAQANSDGWRLLAGKVSVPDCDLSDLTLYFEGPAAGANFFIDDVYVRQDLASAVPNLLANSGFETGVGGWTTWGGTLAASTAQSYTGDQSAKHSGRTGTWQGPVVNVLGQVVPGETYDISAWGRLEGVSADNLFITVKTTCADGSFAYTQVDAITASDSEWRQLSGSITLPACELTETVVYFDGPAEGVNIYLDDAVMLGAVKAAPSNMVSNSGFESGLSGWVTWGGTLAISSDAYAGAQSAVLSGRTGTWQGPVYNLLPTVTAGTSYSISAFSKISGLASADLGITVKTVCDDGTTAYSWAGGNTLNNTSWTQVSGNVTLPSCNLTEVSMYFDGPAVEASIYLDEVTVVAAE